ncbi:MAG: GDP-mannose 4,6-dehydratase [Acidobacteria bacterium]|nr:GDP-mannose 4,6-dehydratase [Acidobacteriota bacterium]
MKKRILVTGSHGFVGNHLVRYVLDNTDWDIVGMDSFRHAGDPLRNHDDPRYTVLCHDLNAPIGDRLSAKIGDVNYIINLASISDVDLSIRDPLWVWENNTRLIGNILSFAHLKKSQGLEKFIHCSTDEVFGPAPPGYFHTEWDTICPSNPYSASKAAQEALCITYWRTYGLPLIITNCMNMVGETQEPTKFIPKIIWTVQGYGEVVVHGSPEHIGCRMYLDAKNLADAWVFLLNNTQLETYLGEGGPQRPSRYNIVGQEEITNLELAERIAKIAGKRLRYRFKDFHLTRPGHDRRYALDGSKIAALGWKHPIPLDETLKRVVAWSIKHPEWLEGGHS